MSFFTTLTDERICQHIETAKKHIIIAAPGISIPVAKALLKAQDRLNGQAVQVVLDVSAQVARLGYGSHDAVKLLRKGGISVRQQSGMRIGVLICDNSGWSFACVPSLVEADPTTEIEAYNAIALTENQIIILRGELPPVRSDKKLDVTVDYPTVGSEPLEEADLEKVTHALDLAPPQPFDLARQTQIYAALIQFVELTTEGFNIQSRRVQLTTNTLPLIASTDTELKDRVSTSLKVLDQIGTPQELIDVTKSVKVLRRAYLVSVGQEGSIMLKSKQADFEIELKGIEQDLDKCKRTMVVALQKSLDQVVDAIAPDLVRAVLADPPPRFRGRFPGTEEYAAIYVEEELSKVFPRADSLIADMKIHKYYKDVTYEMLKDEKFKEKVLSEIPKAVLDGALLQEGLAAKSTSS